MIRYSLKCDKGHTFDSWFKSGEAFEKLKASKMVACAVCGSDDVAKTLMAPSVSTDKERPLSAPHSPAEQALAELRKEVESKSEYVGTRFAKEARAMHDGNAPIRSIYGEAKADEAKALIEEGVPVIPLPFGPKKTQN
ncbi:DUF1178 family protein [Marivivens sp. LCG002]|uniref:DUF1178 family protein n=1 Tax=Marivivens sp. LCG002 TaxID=3051171 RepID=UPI0025578E6F|nr:DUF1178 family protein [Marivivens sp. LCG002]WIV51125.1 DUF1178 family protein [Marivivens sp. LCG002]